MLRVPANSENLSAIRYSMHIFFVILLCCTAFELKRNKEIARNILLAAATQSTVNHIEN